MNAPPSSFPASQRSSYQFPVYKWIGWLAVAGFAIGLTVMFFIAGMFGIPAPLGWAGLVILFTLGALLLDRPKLLLNLMLVYFLLIPMNRLFGLLPIPLPGFVDELFFLPFIAVIVMNWIQRRHVKTATAFPVLFLLLASLSWVANSRPAPFTAIQVTLVMMKFYILWYYSRLTCTFTDLQQVIRWFWGYVIYVAVQYFYNILWHRGLWVRYHPDFSAGVFGPDSYGAHLVGYLSIFALLLLTGWWVTSAAKASGRVKWAAALLAIVISYNLIFMTDTKHALILFPIAFAPFLLHPKFPMRTRIGLVTVGSCFLVAAVIYFYMSVGGRRLNQYLQSVKESPKGDLFYAVTEDFSYLVPYPLLGAGPGRFTSNQARDKRTPLARRYILPYYDQERRLSYFGMEGSTSSASVIGAVNTDFFVLMGEFGWLGTGVYYWFLGWVGWTLFRKSMILPRDHFLSGMFMSLSCCILFLVMVTMITFASTVPALVFPLWMLIGRLWDMPEAQLLEERKAE